MPTLKKIVEDTDTFQGRIFNLTIQFLIILSLVAFPIETLPNLSDFAIDAFRLLELLTVIVFTIEYILRVAVADNKWKFITSFLGIIDLIAVLPFYISTGVDLRSARVFRLMRFFRIFKLMRYNRAIRRLSIAIGLAKEEIILFLGASLVLLYFSAVGIYHFEHEAQPEAFKSVFHSLWWAIVTVSTVGYGDIYPITVGGRIFTFFVLIIGIGVVAVPAGLFASSLSKARELEKEKNTTTSSGPETNETTK